MSAGPSARSVRQADGLDPVRALQRVLYRSAKQDPKRRFHALFDKVARNDGTVRSNQALLPFLGVMAAACVGAVAGALLTRLGFAAYTMVFCSPGEKR